jgi:membrane protein implicated in regulation of membrane protease activity
MTTPATGHGVTVFGNGPPWLAALLFLLAVTLLVLVWRAAEAEDKRRAAQRRRHAAEHRDLANRLADIERYLFNEPFEGDDEWPNSASGP